MTVQELIDELSQIRDKTKEVVFIGHREDEVVQSIKEEEDQVNLHNC